MHWRLFYIFLFLAGAFFSYAQNENGLVAKFTFNKGAAINEISGKRAKESGVLFPEDRFGNPKSACYFHGAPGSYLNLGTDSVLKPVKATIALWVNIEVPRYSGRGYPGNPIIVTKNGFLNKEKKNDDFCEAYALIYQYDSGKITAVSAQSEELHIANHSAYPFSLRTWHHVAIAYDDDSLLLYIDGEVSSRLAKKFRSVFAREDSVVVGHSANKKNERFFNGTVDDLLIYNRVLSGKEILELYHAPNPNRFGIYLKWFLWFLTAAALMALIIFIIVRRQKLKFEKEKEAARLIADYKLIAIKAQVNPHFMSNCLSSIQKLIYSGEIDRAGEYIAKFSVFLRLVLDFSDQHFLTLEQEIHTIKLYVELEQLRFKNNFNFKINIAEGIPVNEILVPALIAQPFIENAIWHGLLPLKGRTPQLSVSIWCENNLVFIVIEDNGIGRQDKNASGEKRSRGNRLATDKMESINQFLSSSDNTLEIKDLFDDNGRPAGTRVVIQLTRYILDE